MLRTLVAGPRPRDLGPRPARRLTAKTPGPARAAQEPHRFWLKGERLWQCLDCLWIKRQPVSPLNLQPRGLLTLAMRQLAAQALSHALLACVVGLGPRVVLFCCRCGS